MINLFRCCAKAQVHARPHVCVIMRCQSEAVKNLWEATNVICTTCICTGAIFFLVFLKLKRGMSAVSSMAMPLRVYMLRTCSAVILVLAVVNSLKMKQMVDFICFTVVERLRA